MNDTPPTDGVSYAKTYPFTCPKCGQQFEFALWLIVDTGERPDLVDRIHRGNLHTVACPSCGPLDMVDAPLLLFRFGAEPAVIFSPAPRASVEQNQEYTQLLVKLLRQSLDNAWQKAWVEHGIPSVHRAMLPSVLSDEIEAAMSQMTEKSPGGQSGASFSIPPAVQPLIDELRNLTHINDTPRRVEVCQQALRLVERNVNPRLWTALKIILGNNLVQNSQGDRADNLELAIDSYQQALQVITRSAMPAEWAQTMYDLANAYAERIRGDKAENVERAIEGYQQALQVRTQSAMPIEWAQTMNNLAIAYRNRIRGDKAENVERAIKGYQQALQVMTQSAMPVDWAQIICNLATIYAERTWGEKAENLEYVIESYQQALQVMTRSTMPIDWAAIMMNLAIAYRNRIRGDKAENLEHAIDSCQQALQVITQSVMPVEWAIVTTNLATAYAERIHGDKAENLEHAIEGYQQALQVMTRSAMPVEWATTMHSLASAYAERIRGDKAENVERAIKGYQQALQVRTQSAMPVEWAQTSNGLANAYAERIQGDKAENVERAIEGYQQALQVRTQSAMPVEWAQTMNHLSVAYKNRIRGDKAENVERAIKGYQQALQVRTRSAMPVEWAMTMSNLANAYNNRIRGDKADNIERAIEGCQQALQVMTRSAMPVEWAMTMSNLANAYDDRIRGDKAENIERAIEGYQQALQVTTRSAMPVEWAKTIDDLAVAFAHRIRGDRAINLECAIEGFQQALQVMTRSAMPVEWAHTMNNLAAAYDDRIRGDKAENIEHAIEGYQQALQVRTRNTMPIEWAMTMSNLANAYANRIQGDKMENLERAIEAFQQVLLVITQSAMPVDWAQIMCNLATIYAERTLILGDKTDNLERAIAAYEQALTVMTQQALPEANRRTGLSLALLLFSQRRWSAASERLLSSLASGEILYTTAASPEAREAELRSWHGAPAELAYSLAQQSSERQELLLTAVITLEQNRARWLAESLALGAVCPSTVPTMAWHVFEKAQKQVRLLLDEARLPDGAAGKRSFLSISQDLTTSYDALWTAVTTVRDYAPEFLPAPTFTQVQAAVQPGVPLVYLLATGMGGLALIVWNIDEYRAGFSKKPSLSAVEAIWLDSLGAAAVSTIVDSYLEAYNHWRKDSRDADARTTWQATLDHTTAWLWEAVMAPIVDHLAQHDITQAVLISGGLLGLLPLHAAWTPDATTPTGRRYALDSVTFRYAPSALALAACQVKAQHISADGMLAVDNPDGSLFFSQQEVDTVLSHFAPARRQALAGPSATLDAVKGAMTSWPVLHFSTHGWAGWGEPLQGGLLLAGEAHLTLAEILALRLPAARLAVLSACETGIPGLGLPDEVIGLPAGLLQAGVAGVAASLWAVNDLSTARLMERFYQYWCDDGLAPAEALCRAQRWLRDVTRAELGDYYASFIARLSLAEAQQARAALLYDGAPGDRPYSHSYHWAAFTFSGV